MRCCVMGCMCLPGKNKLVERDGETLSNIQFVLLYTP